jgi:hypothetical protein
MPIHYCVRKKEAVITKIFFIQKKLAVALKNMKLILKSDVYFSLWPSTMT